MRGRRRNVWLGVCVRARVCVCVCMRGVFMLHSVWRVPTGPAICAAVAEDAAVRTIPGDVRPRVCVRPRPVLWCARPPSPVPPAAHAASAGAATLRAAMNAERELFDFRRAAATTLVRGGSAPLRRGARACTRPARRGARAADPGPVRGPCDAAAEPVDVRGPRGICVRVLWGLHAQLDSRMRRAGTRRWCTS